MVEKTLFAKDLKVKEDIESLFFVKYSSLMEAKDGRKYMNVILSDATGDLESRVWQNAEEHSAKVGKGSFVKVKGKLNIFQGKKQFIIMDLEEVPRDQINEDDFLFKAKETPEIMYEKLIGLVDKLDDFYIRTLLLDVLKDAEIKRRLFIWQAGKSIHHAYKSGLLEHILSCTELGILLSPRYGVNQSYVVAGCILHDLGKIYELTDGVDTEYTEEGKLVGHLVKGPEIVDRFAYRIKGFPYYMKLHLKHILLSHHGDYAYGSPKIPQTSEAMLVHLIDFMDSKMSSFETIKRTDQNSGDWSGYVKHLDRLIYKSELPTYEEPVENFSERGNYQNKGSGKNNGQNNSRGRGNKELKQNLGSLLKDFKVEDGDD